MEIKNSYHLLCWVSTGWGSRVGKFIFLPAELEEKQHTLDLCLHLTVILHISNVSDCCQVN